MGVDGGAGKGGRLPPPALRACSGLVTGLACAAGAFHWKAPGTPLTYLRIYGKMKGAGLRPARARALS